MICAVRWIGTLWDAGTATVIPCRHAFAGIVAWYSHHPCPQIWRWTTSIVGSIAKAITTPTNLRLKPFCALSVALRGQPVGTVEIKVNPGAPSALKSLVAGPGLPITPAGAPAQRLLISPRALAAASSPPRRRLEGFLRCPSRPTSFGRARLCRIGARIRKPRTRNCLKPRPRARSDSSRFARHCASLVA